MKLFAVGPIPMDSETLEISRFQLPYFRTAAFSDMMLECDQILKKLLGADKDTPSMYLTADGTGAMEAAVINIFTKEDRLLIIDGGTFGSRFVKICQIYEIPHTIIKVPFGQNLTREMVYEHYAGKYTGMLVNIHETLSGQLYDIETISEFCSKKKITLVVDAISAFLIDRYEMDKFNIAATVISSQKGLGLAPGLSMLYINQETYEERVKKISPKSLLLRFSDYYPEIKRGQTPYTPPIGVIVQLREKLRRLKCMDLNGVISHNAGNAAYLRKKLKELGFSYPGTNLSNGVTPVICPDNNARQIVSHLVNNDIYVIPSSGELSDKVFRVGHMGLNVSSEDIDVLIECLKSYGKIRGSANESHFACGR